jgi:hypothetical protein
MHDRDRQIMMIMPQTGQPASQQCQASTARVGTKDLGPAAGLSDGRHDA